jgi:L-aspartate oxidase
LDLRSIPPATIQHRFPNIIAICRQWGVDSLHNPIPVAPAAHYWMGGVVTDVHSQTSIAGLYAVGETASTGVHGANRLASNSLLECLVFGAQLRSVDWSAKVAKPTDTKPGHSVDTAQLQVLAMERAVLAEQRSQLPRLMWQCAGICREPQSLDRAIAQVEEWRAVLTNLPLTAQLTQPTENTVNLNNQTTTVRQWAETRNLLDIAYLILRSAKFRTESRGGHYRIDFPDTLPVWQVHTLIQRDEWKKSPAIALGD